MADRGIGGFQLETDKDETDNCRGQNDRCGDEQPAAAVRMIDAATSSPEIDTQ